MPEILLVYPLGPLKAYVHLLKQLPNLKSGFNLTVHDQLVI